MKTIALLLLVFPSIVFAENYYVAPVTGKSVAKEKRDSLRELIENSVMDEGQVVVQSRAKADFWISASIVKTGSKFVLYARKKSGKDTIESRKVKLSSFDDADRAVGKVISALVPLQKNDVVDVVESPPQPQAQPEPEDDEPAVDSQSFGGTSLGVSVFKDYGAAVERGVFYLEGFKEGAYGPHFGFRFAMDASFIVYNFFSDKDENDLLNERSIDSFLSIHLGPVFYILPTDISPFVSLLGGMGAALGASIDDDFNWVIGAEVGLAINRSKSPLAFKVKYLSLANTDLPERPKTLTLAISLSFK